MTKHLESLEKQLAIQSKSLDDIAALAKEKEKLAEFEEKMKSFDERLRFLADL